jgi:hypothetical protein
MENFQIRFAAQAGLQAAIDRLTEYQGPGQSKALEIIESLKQSYNDVGALAFLEAN